MDEAERCHRLAILDRGRLVANGSPQELMANLPGSTLRVDCAEPRRVQQALANQEHVLGVAQIGSSLRVLTDLREGGAEWLRERLRPIGADAHVAIVPANLEDVFVAATRKPAQPAEQAA